MTRDQIILALKAGETGRELDFYFWLAIKGIRERVERDEVYIVHPDGLKEHIGFQDPTENNRHLNYRTWFSATLPKLTTSLDACKHLQEEVLPGWYRMVDDSLPDRCEVCVTDRSVPSAEVREDVSRFFGHGPTECAAWCIAILQALGEPHE